MAYTTVRNAVQIGKAGEFLVCSALEMMGYQTAICNGQGFDLLMFDDYGEAYRVEVKSCKTKSNQRYKFMTATGSGSKKLLSPDDCDIVALVALDEKMIIFMDVMQIKHKKTTVNIGRFDQPEAGQLRKAIASVKARKNS
jgi:Holliday junction resolvase-like predicted endonuclease